MNPPNLDKEPNDLADTLRRLPAINIQRDQELPFAAETLPRVPAAGADAPAPSTANRVFHNFLVQSIGRAYGYGTAFLTQNIILTLLLATTFNDYSIVTIYMSLFSALADGGILFIGVREAAQYPEKIAKIITSTFWLKTLFAAVAYSIGIIIVFFLPFSNDIRFATTLFAASLFFTSVAGTYDVVFQSRQQSRYPTLAEVTARNILFLGMAAALIYQILHLGPPLNQRGLFFVAIGLNIFLNIVIAGIKILGGMRQVPLRFHLDWGYTRAFLMISLPMGVITVLGQIHYKADAVLLSVIHVSDTAVGIYNVAYKVIELLFIFLMLLTSMMFPVLAAYSSQSITAFRGITRRVVDICFVIVVPLAIMIALLAKGAIALISNNHSPQSAEPLALLSLSIIFSIINNIYSYLVIIENRQKQLIWVVIINIIANVSLNLWAIPRYSYNGSAVATVLTEGLGMVLTITVANRQLHVLPAVPSLARALFATGIMAAFIYGALQVTSHVEVRIATVLIGGSAAALYAIIMFIIGGIDPAILRTLGRRLPFLLRFADARARRKAQQNVVAPVRISVIIPTYNRAHLISDAIRSVHHQTVAPYEIIVVDDGSTDDTAAVMRQFPDVRYHVQANGGVESARTAGVQLASGDYIAFLDSDDLLEPIALEQLGRLAQRYPDCGLIYGQSAMRDEQHHIIQFYRPRYRRHAGRGRGLREAIHLAQANYIMGTLIKRQSWDQVNGFDKSFGGFLEDWDLLVRLCLVGPVAYLPEIVMELRFTPGSLLSSHTGERQRERHQRIIDRLRHNPAIWKQVSRRTQRHLIAVLAVSDAGQFFYVDHTYDEAKRALRVAFHAERGIAFDSPFPWSAVMRMWVYLNVPGLLARRRRKEGTAV